MPDVEKEPAPVEAGADAVVEDSLGERFNDHDMSDADDAQQDENPGVLADPNQEPNDAEPVAPRARRRVAPRLVRDLLTYVDDRYAQLFEAVADGHESIMLIQQGLGPFVVKSRASTIVLVEDDADGVEVAGGFDLASIRACARRCAGAVIVHGERHPDPYRAAVAMMAGTSRHVLVVAARPERRQTWEDFLRTAMPRLRIVVEETCRDEVAK